MIDDGHLVNQILDSVKYSSSLVFAHLSTFHRIASFEQFITSVAESRGLSVVRTDGVQGLLGSDVLTEIDSSSILMIDDLEKELSRDNFSADLAALRPVVNSIRGRGTRVLVVSRVPLSHYPDALGSSVLVDSVSYRVKPLLDSVAAETAVCTKMSEKTRDFMIRKASGSRRLLEEFAVVDESDGSNNQKMRAARNAESTVALTCFAELGVEVLGLLEYWVLDAALEILNVEPEHELAISALVQSGLAREVSPDGSTVAFLPMGNRDIWLGALVTALASVTKPPLRWGLLAEALFMLERSLRLRMRAVLSEKTPIWAETHLAQYERGIIELAALEQVSTPMKLGDVWLPLDWLTFGKLLALGQELSKQDGSFLDLTPRDWQTLEQQILPIRNRVAHMRLPRLGDRDTVNRCMRRCELKWFKSGVVA